MACRRRVPYIGCLPRPSPTVNLLMDGSLLLHFLAASAAVLVGLSKTGLPGAAIPAVALMAEAFPDNAELHTAKPTW